jgi:hypothetical protein
MHIKRKNISYRFLTLFLLLSGLGSMSCQTVKPYQRSYLNDSAMKMGLSKGAGVESYAQMIREGASGAGGKNGGGCGCN